ncbi:hypothetical protein EYZ11_003353 [Aspergillus tanneri]|uniref:Ribosome maturation protein SDO1/SBDS N-terminal domain-containing protein n=1 Tax=Aspergillus tanneri TaxID=1220188 RepID=A0A4S3JQQ0_9EURO|nr:uncharacterized protein ATNIH1004_002389 [Aspergillus tanneri]KAA8649715.1 hypothetical protein ATNIH1004_002389 [Aspergillus tanneri]THC97188.1 hypothetical protein EYZ11_003353 [Aspergillus tanneri]
MVRANGPSNKIFYKGASEDFIVFVDDYQALEKWRTDRSIPLSDVLNGWKIFVTHRHGSQGVLDGASKGTLQNEFGTSNEDQCIIKILEKGDYQTYSQKPHQGDTNIMNGPAMLTH